MICLCCHPLGGNGEAAASGTVGRPTGERRNGGGYDAAEILSPGAAQNSGDLLHSAAYYRVVL